MKIKEEIPAFMLRICSGLILLLLILYTFNGSVEWLHSDSAAQVNFALEMIRKQSPFPENWVGSTGILVHSYLILPFLWIGLDLFQAKLLLQFVYICLMAAALYLFSKKGLGNQSWILMFPCLFTYLSGGIQYDMLYIQCAYTMIIVFCLLSMTLLCKNVSEDSVINTFNQKLYCMLVGVVFLGCLFGIMYLQAIYLPILGTLAFLYIEKYKNHKITVFLPHIKSFVLRVVGIVLAGGIGYLISIKLSRLSGVVGNHDVTALASSFPEIMDNFSVLVQGIFRYAGFELGVQLFSCAGILSVIRFVFFVFITIITPILAYRQFSLQSIQNRAVMMFTLIHSILAVTIVIFCGVSATDPGAASRYMLTSFVLLQLIGINYLYTNYIQPANFLSLVYASGASVVTLMMMLHVILTIPNGAMLLEKEKGITEFLQQHDLEYGYATFWNAGKNTVLSNGEVQINSIICNTEQILPYYWLSSRDWYQPEYYDGDTFLMLTDEELTVYAPNGVSSTNLGEPEQVFQYENYTIFVYDYNISENGFGGKLEGNVNLLSRMTVSDTSMKLADGSVQIQPGQVLFGPYLTLDAGQYILRIEAECQEEQPIRVTAKSGQNEIANAKIHQGTTEIAFSLDGNTDAIEFVIDGVSVPIKITSITIEAIK